MLNLFCPTCQRDCDETELSCGGQAHLIRRDHASSDKDFYEYLYERKNDKGIIFERWRQFMVAENGSIQLDVPLPIKYLALIQLKRHNHPNLF